jgi:uncharacterized membrane protein SirB2
MIAFYAQIKLVHIFVALLSGTVFAVRGGCVLAGARWPLATPVRWASYAIDTTLLTAALMLLTILPRGLFANGWLAVKVGLIVTYVVLATLAMKRARTPRTRRWCYAAALLAFVAIYSTARAHSPLGIYTWWFG